MLENMPLSPIYQFSPAVYFVGGSGAEVVIDDLSVKINTADEATDNDWSILFNEDFERFIDGAQLKDSGWIQPLVETKEKAAEAAGEKENISIVQESTNAGQSLRIKTDGENEAVIVKSFQVPHSFPFDVSDKPFEIRYNSDMNRSISPIPTGNEMAEAYPREMDYNAHGPYFPPVTIDTVTSSGFGQIQAVTVTYTDTYYIYSFDGKLLSEYDQTGSCVRDYIYAGNRLLAEYRPSTGKYYYYMSDQINSTRIITDDIGNVVYSEAYGPYGDVQKTWTKTYDPKQKFSGKEREGYSELDYFGARYFDNNSYRFISVDPIINKEGAIGNPQLWNLYTYCGNNPITYLDPDGRDVILLNKSDLIYGDGHNAVLIGRDKDKNGNGGWEYKSKDGLNKVASGSDVNSTETFDTLNDFKKSDYWGKYDKKYRMKTDADTDRRMQKTANIAMKIKYQIFKKYDINGKVTGMNCADLTEVVLKIGGKNVPEYKSFTSPNLQYEFVMKYNEGEVLK
ncbi:MAG: RHS repeat-associated core domain-containing protein [Candidatus Aminicenantes bacterium]|nr:RHS repeat-associated core domain-containing protein [Candidatus Aminicenantes bacterium]